jgi:transposase InsO family protein
MNNWVGLGRLLTSRKLTFQPAQEAVELYNEKRPHLSLKM